MQVVLKYIEKIFFKIENLRYFRKYQINFQNISNKFQIIVKKTF